MMILLLSLLSLLLLLLFDLRGDVPYSIVPVTLQSLHFKIKCAHGYLNLKVLLTVRLRQSNLFIGRLETRIVCKLTKGTHNLRSDYLLQR